MTESSEKIFYPDSDLRSLNWTEQSTSETHRRFREGVMISNMIAKSQLGRAVFTVKSSEIGEAMVARPDLSPEEDATLRAQGIIKMMLDIPFRASQEGLAHQ